MPLKLRELQHSFPEFKLGKEENEEGLQFPK
jgi:hypothetical protein